MLDFFTMQFDSLSLIITSESEPLEAAAQDRWRRWKFCIPAVGFRCHCFAERQNSSIQNISLILSRAKISHSNCPQPLSVCWTKKNRHATLNAEECDDLVTCSVSWSQTDSVNLMYTRSNVQRSVKNVISVFHAHRVAQIHSLGEVGKYIVFWLATL